MQLTKKILVLLGDIFVLYLALFATVLIRYGLDFGDHIGSHLLPFSLVFIFWLILFYLNDLYRLQVLRNKIIIIQKLAVTVSLGIIASTVIFYSFGQFFKLTPKTNLLIFGFLFLILNGLWRLLAFDMIALEKINLAFLGDSPLALQTINYLKENSYLGYEIKVYEKRVGKSNLAKIKEKIKRGGVKLLVVQPKLLKNRGLIEISYELLPFNINLVSFLDFYEKIFEKAPLQELSLEWFVEKIYTYRPYYDRIKRLFEFFFGVFLIIALTPLILLIGILVKLTSGGPIIYAQKRFGKNGKVFTFYKFRTMYHRSGGPLFTEAEDKRITALGKILRMTHLDETPQLINVIKGDLSITGPRPERTELAEKYKALPYYEIRHIIKPGLTGWAQVNYRASTSLEEAYEKLCYDVYYVKNRSLILDFIILLKTIRHLLVVKGY